MRLHLPAFAALALLAAAPADAATRTLASSNEWALTALIAKPPEPLIQAAVMSWVLTDTVTGPVGWAAVLLGSDALRADELYPVGPVDSDTLEAGDGVSGSGAAEVSKITVDRLRVSVTGSASVALGGAAEAASFFVRGPSAVDAEALSAKAATIAADGATRIKLTATDTAKVDADGLATVKLAGRPACSVRPTSTAEVIGCR